MLNGNDNNLALDSAITKICSDAIRIVKYARTLVIRNIDIIQLITYYIIGKWIVEVQQKGETRAEYGKKILETLSITLNNEFGKGFSIAILENYRKFYITYKNRIPEPVVREFIELKTEPVVRELKNIDFMLDWSHYLILMRIENEEERNFYEIESKKSNWSKRELQRQYNSSLYERLALSKDKNAVMKMAKEGNVIEKPSDIIKQPTVLVDLKIDKVTHQDLGQMQMYVNYFDRYEKKDFENLTIGILLCKEKDDALIELTLPENANIFASEYKLYLPDKKVLKEKLKQWIRESE